MTDSGLSGFALHDIKHSSASSINLFDDAPDIFVAEKLCGLKGTVGPAAHRGNAVEYALVQILANGFDHSRALDMGIAQFNAKTALIGGEKTDKEREVIPGCVEQGLLALKDLGIPEFDGDGKQHKIELLCKTPEWSLPLIGFLDLLYPHSGRIVDIKTTLKAPSEMSIGHKRQAAIYQGARGNQAVDFLYLTPKKFIWHKCDDVAGTLAECKQILIRQEEFLRNTTKEELAPWFATYKKMFPQGRNRFNF